MAALCPAATSTPAHCGDCATTCPGASDVTVAAGCTSGTTCTFACAGENYDLDGMTSNGCDTTDSPTGFHTQAMPRPLPSVGCGDGASAQNVSGLIPADRRTHIPPIDNFNSTLGTAPDWFSLTATGSGVCSNDIVLTLQVTGSADPTCFTFTVISNTTYTCTTVVNATGGGCTINGTYPNNTNLLWKVEKTCGTSSTPELATYTITGHL